MNIEDTDALLTAYATNELTADEQADVAARLEDDPDLRDRLMEIRAMIATLTAALHAEPLPAATAPTVEIAEPAVAQASSEAPRRSAKAWWVLSSAAAAACVAIGVGVMIHTATKGRESTRVVLNNLTTAQAADVVIDARKNVVSETKVTEAEATLDPTVFAQVGAKDALALKNGVDALRAQNDEATAETEKWNTHEHRLDTKSKVEIPTSPASSPLPSILSSNFGIGTGRDNIYRSRNGFIGGLDGKDSILLPTDDDGDGDGVKDASGKSKFGLAGTGKKVTEGDQTVAQERGVGTDATAGAVLDKVLPEVAVNAIALSDVLDFLHDTTQARFFVNWKALEAAGVSRDAEITLSKRSVKLSEILDLALQQANGREKIQAHLENGYVVITTETETRKWLPEVDVDHNTEAYDRIIDNPFLAAQLNPLSTFSIDVDTAAYSNFRRFITGGQLPPPDAVRIEEMVNYFPYDYAPPKVTDVIDQKGPLAPFSANMEVASAPWAPKHRLVRIGLKGRVVEADKRPPSNLVFLLDVSGSMDEANKLPLVKQSMKKLIARLSENDRVAIAVYAGNSGLVLPSTRAIDQMTIMKAIDDLKPGGSTNGAEGIALAYQQAESGFIKDGTNRVILCTDGDFNVGITDLGQLTRLIESKAKSGTFLSVLGFGMGNLKDSTMEKLADKGNGNYAYIDTAREADKVLVEQLSGTLVTIAKDVKIQVEFNPAKVARYRLIGYENRMLAKEDFNDDLKDAGEIGAGHTVTALYEIVPADAEELRVRPVAEIQGEIDKIKDLMTRARLTPDGLKALNNELAILETEKAEANRAAVDALKYQAAAVAPTTAPTTGPVSDELLTLKLRYKAPDAKLEQGTSELIQFTLKDDGKPLAQASPDFKFAAGVAGVGMLLRESQYKGTATYDALLELAQQGLGADKNGYRAEFVELLKQTKEIAARTPDMNK